MLFAAAEAPLGEVAIWPDSPGPTGDPPERLFVLGKSVRQGFTALAACEGYLAVGDKSGNVWLCADPALPAAAPAEGAAPDTGRSALWLATTHWQAKRVTGVCVSARAGVVLSGSLDGTLHVCRLSPRPPADEAAAARVAEGVAPAGVTARALVGDERRAVVGCTNGMLCIADMTALPKLGVQVAACPGRPALF